MLGIDIGKYSVKMASVKVSGKKITVENFATETLPENERGGNADIMTLQRIISTLAKGMGTQTSAATAVPISSSIIKTVSFGSKLSEEELEGEVQMSLMNFIPFPLDQINYDYVTLGKSKANADHQDVLIVASRKDQVELATNAIDIKTIKSKAVDVEVFCYANVLEKLKGVGYRENYGVIDVGYKTSRIYIYNSGNVLYSREVQVGGHQLTEAISDSLGLSIEDAESKKIRDASLFMENSDILSTYLEGLVEQIDMALEMFESSNESSNVAEFYFVGGGASVKNLVQQVNSSIDRYEFKPMVLDQILKVNKKIKSPDSINLNCLSLGLSMRR